MSLEFSNELLLLLPIESLQRWWGQFNGSPEFKALSGAVSWFAVALGIVIAQLENIQKLLELLQKIKAFFNPAKTIVTAPTNTQDLRSRLLKILKSEYARRLEDSQINQAIPIALEFQDRRDLVGRSQPLGFDTRFDQGAKYFSGSIVDIYSQLEINGKLLVVGRPGSGKTTEILKFASLMTEKAETVIDSPIPVLLELSAWQDDGTSLENWIARRLKQLYNIDHSIALEWLHDEKLILLLDGLNEVGFDSQGRCIDVLNQFLHNSVYPYCIVCCRLEDYERGHKKLTELNGAIYLQPLSDALIQKYLDNVENLLHSNSTSTNNLTWETLVAEPTLRELVRSPLMLTMLVAVYEGKQIQTSPEELLNLYVDQCFSKSVKMGNWKAPDRPQTVAYLRWLAQQLKLQAKPELLIERIQPSWLPTARDRLLYRFYCGLIIALFCAVIVALVVTELDFPPELQLFGIVLAIASGFVYGVYSREDLADWLQNFPVLRPMANLFDNEEIEPVRLGWSWRRSKTGFLTGLLMGSLLGGGILLYDWILGEFWLGLRWGSAVFLSYGCFVAIVSGLQAGVKSSSSPNQGMWDSLKNTIAVIILGSLIGSLIAQVALIVPLGTVNDQFSQWIGIGSGLLSGLFSGGLPCIQHVVLRCLLWRRKAIPWNYAKFLEYCHRLGLLQQVGGQYRFLHELMRSHFESKI